MRTTALTSSGNCAGASKQRAASPAHVTQCSGSAAASEVPRRTDMLLEKSGEEAEHGGVTYRVFAQRTEPRVDLAALVQNARKYFEARVEVLAEEGARATLRLESAKYGYVQELAVHARMRTAADVEDARAAEVRGRAGGMAALAERCGVVWEVHPVGDATELSVLTLCALLAATGLGPVLPPDGSTLFGVRGSRERVEALGGGRTLSR